MSRFSYSNRKSSSIEPVFVSKFESFFKEEIEECSSISSGDDFRFEYEAKPIPNFDFKVYNIKYLVLLKECKEAVYSLVKTLKRGKKIIFSSPKMFKEYLYQKIVVNNCCEYSEMTEGKQKVLLQLLEDEDFYKQLKKKFHKEKLPAKILKRIKQKENQYLHPDSSLSSMDNSKSSCGKKEKVISSKVDKVPEIFKQRRQYTKAKRNKVLRKSSLFQALECFSPSFRKNNSDHINQSMDFNSMAVNVEKKRPSLPEPKEVIKERLHPDTHNCRILKMVDFVDRFEKKEQPDLVIENHQGEPQRRQRRRKITWRKKRQFIFSPNPKLIPACANVTNNIHESFMSYHKNKDGKKCFKSRLRSKLSKRQKANNFIIKRNQNLKTRNKELQETLNLSLPSPQLIRKPFSF
ncbi:unnamed protein product [Moneuplotes crassus]|uniref:Uncharacterized protein n=1 Tax=Euplotes crassus TaxID=5936 RepID=A0AAD1Y3Z2_EUPCR|nr:unnamed protein product [Moneuplotes crassus]